MRSAPGDAPTEQELFDCCREHLAPHETPRHWRFVGGGEGELVGKIQKFVLRDRFTAEQADD